jgi:hypothetical protein
MNTHRSLRLRAAFMSGSVALALAGCVNYTPSQLSGMSTVDICETEYMQRPNLSPEAKQAIQAELQRRNDNCRNHAAEVAQRYEDFMYRETYGKGDSPP